jgi:hypothetical protein
MMLQIVTETLNVQWMLNHQSDFDWDRRVLVGWRFRWKQKQRAFLIRYERTCGFGSIEFVRQRPGDLN